MPFVTIPTFNKLNQLISERNAVKYEVVTSTGLIVMFHELSLFFKFTLTQLRFVLFPYFHSTIPFSISLFIFEAILFTF